MSSSHSNNNQGDTVVLTNVLPGTTYMVTGATTGLDWGQSNSILTNAGSYKTAFRTGTRKGISPRLYFKYVKSKLKRFTPEEKAKISNRMRKLKRLLSVAIENEQQALYETVSRELVKIVKQSEAVAAGYGTYVEKAAIDKFMHMVQDTHGKKDQEKDRPVIQLRPLSEFPRLIPQDIKAKIKDVKRKGIFDELHVLYLEYRLEDGTTASDEVKSTKQKIREKDPILFGRFSFAPNEYYYIADWVDEYCDLTFQKFVEQVRDSDFGDRNDVTHEVPEIDDAFIERLKKEVSERDQALSQTRPSNFRQLMAEQEQKAVKTPEAPAVQGEPPRSWRQRLMKRLGF